jgi:folate-binding protein YgfZ
LVAIAEIHRVDDGFLLLLERSRGTDLMARLRRFVLRAKVTFAEADAQWRVLGLLGEGAQARLGSTGLDLPGSDAPVAVSPDGSRVVRLPGAPALPRWLVLRPAAAAELPQLEGAAQEDPAAWTWGRIQAAIPLIHEGTVERFVPQSLNLECLDGVSFRKGCYPGQEVVARSQYLGKLRRRMALAHSPAAVVGEDIFAQGREEPVGRVVLAAPVPGGVKGHEHGGVTDLARGDTQGGWDLLLECPADLPGSTQLRAGSPQAPALDMRPLPYPIFDPTA